MASPKVTLKGAHHVVTVNVTEPLIDRAEQRNSGHCMIADAIRMVLPNAKSVYVDLATIRFTDPVKRQRYIYLTPSRAQQALIHFDQGIHNEPFTLQLKKAIQVVESGAALQADGSRKRPSEAVQGIVKPTGGGGAGRPIKLGGELPERGAISSSPSRSKKVIAAQKAQQARRAEPTTTTKTQKRAASLAAATQAAEQRAQGGPATEASNITMAPDGRRGLVREFGLRQLQP